VGRELNVRAVLTGHVQPQGDDIVIGLELVDVRDGRQLWGAQYRRKAGDLVQAQEDISRAVSERLRLRLTGADADHLNEAPTTNGEAYQLYLKGRFAWRQLTEEGLTRSIEYFLQAVQKDPDYALAYSGLADAYIALGSDALPPHEAMPKAAAYARKALALDPDLVDAQVAVGIVKLIYDWDWPGAEAALRFDRVLTSSSVDAFSCSLHYADVMGRNREMIEALHGALATDPVSLRINLELGCASYYGRQYDQAIRQFQGTLTLYPDHPVASWEIGRAYGQKQMHADAIAALQKVKGSSGDWPPIVSELAYVHARSGRRREALARLNELTEQSARRFVDPYLFAAVHAGLGETDQTFLWLDKAVAARSGWIPWLKIEPKWDGIRSDSRFAALLQRVGLPH
jgi:tetratricopeptide (TPR) repeat protein